MLFLGLGAGLRAGEIVAARGGAVVRSPSGVSLTVRSGLRHVVAVEARAAAGLARLAAAVGEGPLFHPGESGRSYPNFVNDFCRRLVFDPGAPRLTVARARSSFVCDHLSAGTGLAEPLSLTGIAEVESLLYYSRHSTGAPQSKAALRRALAGR